MSGHPERFLLIQARTPDDPMKAQELTCFAERAGLDESVFRDKNVAEDMPRAEWLEGMEAVFVGGSGSYSVSHDVADFVRPSMDLLVRAMELDIPIFAACFGFHLLGVALGGKVVTIKNKTEVGTYTLRLFPEARGDELFQLLPDPFEAQEGHTDFLVEAPGGVALLSYSENTPIQAFRVNGRKVWATQFHPELNSFRNEERYRRYVANYGDPDTLDEDILARFHDSPETEGMIRYFIENIVNGHGK